MTAPWGAFAPALERAAAHAQQWLTSLPSRPVPPGATADEVLAVLGGPLPEGPTSAEEVVDLLAAGIEPGLMAIPSGRFFGWVMGGTQPAALAADWLTSAWDQNAGMRGATPGAVAVEEAAASWLLDVLGLPATADVGFVTGATMANFTGLAAARRQVLTDAGWDLDRLGLTGAPRVRVLVGSERHGTVDLALRYLGLGAPTEVAADRQGRLEAAALAQALADGEGPAIVCLQAGNLTPGRSTRSRRRSRSPMSTGRGCTSTARSASGRGRHREPDTSSRATRRPTRGRPTRTRRSTCRTTAASPWWRDGRHSGQP